MEHKSFYTKTEGIYSARYRNRPTDRQTETDRQNKTADRQRKTDRERKTERDFEHENFILQGL